MSHTGVHSSNAKPKWKIAGCLLIFALLPFPLGLPLAADGDSHEAPAPAVRWEILDMGLEMGFLSSPQPAEIGDSVIRVLRVDPQHFRIRLLNASATADKEALTAKQWCRRYGLTAAINASMYQADYLSSVSFMRTREHTNNRHFSKDMSILAFDRLSEAVPPVKIIDRQCDDFDRLKDQYGTLVQSIRMISCTGQNVWRQQPKKHSTAAIAVDSDGRLLLIHVGSLYTTHDLVEILQAMPLNISRAMYTEGGPQAQLHVRYGSKVYNFAGGYEMNFIEGDGAALYRPVPNVIGIAPK
jgi:hypothetical protein